jgi:hypothetical protein
LCLRTFGSGIGAKLDLCEALARDLAGLVELDLADIAKAFAPLLPADDCRVQRLLVPRSRTPNPGRLSSHSMWSALPPGIRSAATLSAVSFILGRFPFWSLWSRVTASHFR